MAHIAQLNDQLLTQFMETFYGFGSYAGKYWFVGMEEAGGQTVEAIQVRLTQWQQVVERPFTKQESPKCLTAVQDGTYFFVIDHPVARGASNRYFEQVGKRIAHSGGSDG